MFKESVQLWSEEFAVVTKLDICLKITSSGGEVGKPFETMLFLKKVLNGCVS